MVFALPFSNAATCHKDSNQIILPLIEESPVPLTHPTSNNNLQKPIDLMPDLLHSPEKFRGPEDVDFKITHLRNLCDQPLDSLNLPHHEVITSLVKLLAARVNGEAGYALEDIGEIVALCRRLLTMDTPPDLLTSAFQALTRAVLDGVHRDRGIQSLDQ